MRLKLLIIIVMSLLISNSNAAPLIDISKYDLYYKEKKYEMIIHDLTRFLDSYNVSTRDPKYSEETVTHARNLVADSYRMQEKYTNAGIWYATSDDIFFDEQSKYSFAILQNVAKVIRKRMDKERNIKKDYIERLNPKEKCNEILHLILMKNFEPITPTQKQKFFKEIYQSYKNQDWPFALIKYCAGDISIEELWGKVPEEYMGVTQVVVGLHLESQDDFQQSQMLFKRFVNEEDAQEIERLIALNHLGLFALRMIYTEDPKYESDYLSDIYSLKASSAKFEDGRLYGIKNIIDIDPKTAWVPSGDKSGINEWAEFSFDDPKLIKSITLINGYAKSDESFYKNNRVQSVTLVYDDSSKSTVTLRDDRSPQTIKVEKRSRTVRLIINSVYKGSTYNDTCISEINVNFGK